MASPSSSSLTDSSTFTCIFYMESLGIFNVARYRVKQLSLIQNIKIKPVKKLRWLVFGNVKGKICRTVRNFHIGRRSMIWKIHFFYQKVAVPFGFSPSILNSEEIGFVHLFYFHWALSYRDYYYLAASINGLYLYSCLLMFSIYV